MPIVNIVFDKEKDLYNIWTTCNHPGSFGVDFKEKLSKKIIEICHEKKFEDIKDNLEKHYSQIYNSSLTSEVAEAFAKSWGKIEKEYFRRLEKITSKKFPCKKVMAFLTTASRCPYDPKIESASFFINFFSGIPNAIKTCGHELMHIHFHNTDWKYVEEKIGYEKTKDLKESLTVLLNLEFKDLLIAYDEGYPKHKELRGFIESEWKKEKDFKKLLDKCINYLK